LNVSSKKSERETSKRCLKTVNVMNHARESSSSSKKRLNTRSSRTKRKSVLLQNARPKYKDRDRKRPIERNKKRPSKLDKWSINARWKQK
jgi:hypothetical protein